MFFSRVYNKLTGRLSQPVNTKNTKRLAVLDHKQVHGDNLDRHVLRNGDLDLEGYLSSIGLVGGFGVWATVEDVNGETGAEADAYLDAMVDAVIDAVKTGKDEVVLPQPSDPLAMVADEVLDDLGCVTIYTIVDNETNQIIGDAVHAKDQHRWLFEYDPSYMSYLCN